MSKKINNLLTFKNFDGELPTNIQKKTKRTDVGLDVLNESADLIQMIAAIVNDAGFTANLTTLINKLSPSVKEKIGKILGKN